MELRKFQKNELFKLIKNHGVFQIDDFTWETYHSEFDFEDFPKLIFKNKGFIFNVMKQALSGVKGFLGV